MFVTQTLAVNDGKSTRANVGGGWGGPLSNCRFGLSGGRGWTELAKENQVGPAGPGVSLVPRSNPSHTHSTVIHDRTRRLAQDVCLPNRISGSFCWFLQQCCHPIPGPDYCSHNCVFRDRLMRFLCSSISSTATFTMSPTLTSCDGS